MLFVKFVVDDLRVDCALTLFGTPSHSPSSKGFRELGGSLLPPSFLLKLFQGSVPLRLWLLLVIRIARQEATWRKDFAGRSDRVAIEREL